MRDFRERLKEGVVIFDGAIGTMLYDQGVFISNCFEELCLTRGEQVQALHEAYAAAGADVIETNSFGANRLRLAKHGLADQVENINRSAVQLARAAAGEERFVAGSVGPCLDPGQTPPEGDEEACEELDAAFREQIGALLDGGVDLIMLETFRNLDELDLAIEAARKAMAEKERDLPLLTSVTVSDDGETALGTPVEKIVSRLEKRQVDGIGFNCGVGPAAAFEILERAAPLTDLPLLIMPNAGLPRQVEGRMMYLNNPEYFTEYAKRYVQAGARCIGGCCGSTPEHIREAARAVRSLTGVRRHVKVEAVAEDEEALVEGVEPMNKSRFANRILSGRQVTSIEIMPPRSTNLDGMMDKVRTCYTYGVDAINIPDGPRASSRVSPMVTAIAIRNRIGIEPIIHYCCRDRNLIGMQSDLMGGFAAGLTNFLIITGDPPKLGDYPEATGVFDVDAVGLTRVANRLNHGLDIGGNRIDPPTGFFIGVGANPCAVDLEHEHRHLRRKIDAGAEFIITQPVFQPDALTRFIDRARSEGPVPPVVAGIWPLVSLKNAEFMRNEVPGVEVPDRVIERMRGCQTREEGVKEGVRIAADTCGEVREHVAGFQVSAPFGRVETALEVLDKAGALRY